MELGERSLLQEYNQEKSVKTLALGRKLCTWGLPLALIITFVEAWTYKNPAFIFSRFLFIVPASIYLVIIRKPWSKEKSNIILPLHAATIAGGLLMMLSLSHLKLNLVGYNPAFQVASVTGGLVTLIFVAYVFSAGAQKYVRYLLVSVLILLFFSTYLNESLTWKDMTLFINPVAAVMAVILLSIYDEERSYSNFKWRKEFEAQQERLRQEIEERKALEERLHKQLEEDYLTGVYNRRVAFNLLDRYITKPEPFSLCYIDIDNFKTVNDEFGHTQGDILLIAFADFLRENIRKSDFLCRIGGDEFLVILPGCHPNEARTLIERIRSSFVETKMVNNISLDFSYGFSHYDLQKIINSYELLEAADRNMYSNKAAKF